MTGPTTGASGAGRPVVPRAPFSRPDTAATGRPERPDPCTDPPTVRFGPAGTARARPLPGPPDDGDGDGDGEAEATVPRLVPVRPRPAAARAGSAVRRRLLAVGSAVGSAPGFAVAVLACAVLACAVLAARPATPVELGRPVAVAALVAVAAGAAAAVRRDRRTHHRPGGGRPAAAAPQRRPARRDALLDVVGSVHRSRTRPSSAGPAPGDDVREVP